MDRKKSGSAGSHMILDLTLQPGADIYVKKEKVRKKAMGKKREKKNKK